MADPRNRSTPDAAVMFLRKLWRNELLSTASTQYLLELMYAQTTPARLRAGLPSHVRLADKCGTSVTVDELTAAFNDIGILRWPRLSDRGSELLDRGPDALEQPVAGFSQRDAPRVSLEQTNADAFLEPANHLAQRRRGDSELLGRTSEIERLRDGDERAKLAEVAGGENAVVGAHEVIA
jgi:hypothetical protein